jgi:putative transposase
MEELYHFITSNPDPRELKRALAVSMTLRGQTHREIMATLQVSSGFISKWKQAFIFDGVPALKLAHKGSKGYLNPEQKQGYFILKMFLSVSRPNLQSRSA